MSIKDQLRAAIDILSEEEAAAVLLVLQREHDDIDDSRDRQATAHAAMQDAMASAEALADDE
jgi:hypothetical protein